MAVLAVLDSAGRRRSPATMPDYHAGRPPRNKGLRYPADPPTVEEIVAVMRQVGTNSHGARLRAVIVILWRAGLRIQEALALTEHDLDPHRGSILVGRGKGGRRRKIGMDEWGFEQLRPRLVERERLSVGPLALRNRWADPGAALVSRGGPGRVPEPRRASRGAAPLRPPPAPSRARARARPRGRAAQRHPAPARPRQSGDDLDLPPGHRHRGDHRDCPCKASADDAGQRRVPVLTHRQAQRERLGGAPASPWESGSSGSVAETAAARPIRKRRGRGRGHLLLAQRDSPMYRCRAPAPTPQRASGLGQRHALISGGCESKPGARRDFSSSSFAGVSDTQWRRPLPRKGTARQRHAILRQCAAESANRSSS
jgi:hypothetical protein